MKILIVINGEYNKIVGGASMKIIKGKYTDAYVYATIIDEATKLQIKTLIDQSFMKNSKVRIMADCHSGAGCVIGTTITITDKVVPNLVGVDIGCGMLCIKLGKIAIDYKKIDEFIHISIPAGQHVNTTITPSLVAIEDLKCFNELKKKTYLKMSLGSLGGGNHFIEIDKSSSDEYFLIIHSGSRNLGNQVANIYQKKAIMYHENKILNRQEEIKRVISEYKSQGREREIENEIKRIKTQKIVLDMPHELCYLEGDEFKNYLHDMNICQRFASENRYEIARRIVGYLGLELDSLINFETIHNYINMDDMILRKGAISAYKDEYLLIPINMRDGCIIAKGKSNPDYNYSAPHGAGRIMSRKKAFDSISLADFENSMQGIYSSTIATKTIDESPFAYKPLEAIIENIKDTVDIIEVIKPVYSFKALE